MVSTNKIKAGEAFIVLRAIDKASPVLKRYARNFMEVGREIRNFGFGIMAAGAAISASFIKPIKAASEVTEQQNKFFQVFGTKIGKDVEDRMKAIGDETGRTHLKMYKFAASFGGLMKGQGATTEMAADVTKSLVKLGIDFSSFNDILDDTREGSMKRFLSALSGSAEVLDQFGVTAKETAVAPMLQKMFGVGTRGANDLQKSLARAVLIFQSMKRQNALNDAIRTSKELANGWRNFQDMLYEIKYYIGMALLPIVGATVQYLIRGAVWLSKWVQESYDLIIAVALIAVGMTLVGGLITSAGVGAMFLGAVLFGISQILIAIKAILIGIGIVVSFITGNIVMIAVVLGLIGSSLAFWLVWGSNMVDMFGTMFAEIVMIGKAMWKAFSTGRFELAWNILAKSMQYSFLKVAFVVEDFLRGFYNGMRKYMGLIRNLVVGSFDTSFSTVKILWMKVVSFIAGKMKHIFLSVAVAFDKIPGMGNDAQRFRDMAKTLNRMSTGQGSKAEVEARKLSERQAARTKKSLEAREKIDREHAAWRKKRQGELDATWESLQQDVKDAYKPKKKDEIILPEIPGMPGFNTPSESVKKTLPEALQKGTAAAARKAWENTQTKLMNNLIDENKESNEYLNEMNTILKDMFTESGAIGAV